MNVVEDFGLYPHATIDGRPGPAVDTGIDVHFAGPGRVYLHPQNVGEAVRVSHHLDDVAGVLESEGWVRGEDVEAALSALTVQHDDAIVRAAEAEAKVAAVLATLQLVQPAAPATPAPAQTPAQTPAPSSEPVEAKRPAKTRPAKETP